MSHSCRELRVWQLAMELVEQIYRITETFPAREIYGLTSQLRKAAVSVPSNIAEGQGRSTAGEFRQFLANARGSLFEVETQLVIAARLGYLSSSQLDMILERTGAVNAMLNGLLTSLAKKRASAASS